MVQAVSTAKTAESSMIAAKQAAKEATMSFQLTQRSVKEMMRLMNQTNSLTRLLRPG